MGSWLKSLFEWLKSLFKKEPVVIIAAVMSIFPVLAALGVAVTPEFQEAVRDALIAILLFLGVGAGIARQSVYAPANVVAAKKGDVVVAGPAATLVSVKVGEQVMVKSFGDGPDDPFGH